MLRRWKRRPRLRRDWDERLAAWAEKAWVEPHRFGRHDCLLAALDAVEAQTGRDFAQGHRRKWRSRTGGARYLRSLGLSSLEAAIDLCLDEVPVAFAQRGDLVLVDGAPGVCLGAEALIVHPGGPLLAPRSAWTKAWSVGRRTVGHGQ
ncbi:MAG TPA: hypothetical protein VEA60_16015 [Allosphingosinicella sp.]|nr:hypothetical protein [Allosphingosinicella sp.]